MTVRGPLGGSSMVVALLLALLSLAEAQQPATPVQQEGPPQSSVLEPQQVEQGVMEEGNTWLDPNVTDMNAIRKSKRDESWQTLMVGVQRKFQVGTPMDFDAASTNSSRRALIVLLHGFTDTADVMFDKFVGLLKKPDGPILVAPQGTSSYGMPPSWGARGAVITEGPDGPMCSASTKHFGCAANFCGGHRRCGPCLPWFECASRCVWATCVDDFEFISKLLDYMIEKYPIDESQIFLSGFSMGGIISWDLASEPGLSQRFAAIAPLHGSPLAGMIRAPPAPAQAPYLLGTWGAEGTDSFSMDMMMPPWPNVEGRSDKSVTMHNIGNTGGEFYYSTAENATTFYARSIQCPPPGKMMSVEALMSAFPDLVQKEHIRCYDDGCNGAVVRCLWGTREHVVPDFAAEITWAFFKAAVAARR